MYHAEPYVHYVTSMTSVFQCVYKSRFIQITSCWSPVEMKWISIIFVQTFQNIVCTSQEMWNHPICSDVYEDNRVVLSVLCPDWEFAQDWCHILSLEKVDNWDDEDEWELLQSVSRLMKGMGTVEDFLHHYNENCYKRYQDTSLNE